MMRVDIPKRFEAEHASLTAAWLNSELSFDEVVDRFASAKYKAWHFARVTRKDALYAQGIIEN